VILLVMRAIQGQRHSFCRIQTCDFDNLVLVFVLSGSEMC